jgi:metal-responsive CopG/Arc/MetJ family transcriptional regulator
MGSVNVFLDDQLLARIDEEAKAEGTDRSALIETVLKKHIEAKRREREEKREQKRMQEASRKLDALAKRLGRWDAQAIIRRFRDTNLKGDS